MIYPAILNENAPIVCGSCGARIGTLGELRRMAERTSTPRSIGLLPRRIL